MPLRRRAHRRSASGRAIASRSTCRMVPEAGRSRCSPARASARTHIGRLRRLLRRGARATASTTPAQGRHHRRRRLAARQGRAAQGRRSTRRSSETPIGREACVVVQRTRRRAIDDEGGPRPLVARARSPARPRDCAPASRSTPSTRSSSSTRRARPGSPRASLHTTAGYLRRRAPHDASTSSTCSDDDVYWCTADIGWVTGHSYVVYGPLSNGATCVMYEGAPELPRPGPLLGASSSGTGVTILYTAPTAIRAFMRWGDEWPQKHDLSSLRLLGTRRRADQPRGVDVVPRASSAAGAARSSTPGGRPRPARIMITPLPGRHCRRSRALHAACRSSASTPRSSKRRRRRRARRTRAASSSSSKPWPSMLRTLWGDDERYVKQYWSEIPGVYFTGDGARRDEDGYFWVMGRIDDVLNVAGHRLGTAEIESALVCAPGGRRGRGRRPARRAQGPGARRFVTLKAGQQGRRRRSRRSSREHVGKEIGAFARPDEIRFTDALPKTRSGKIMRRLLQGDRRRAARRRATRRRSRTLGVLALAACAGRARAGARRAAPGRAGAGAERAAGRVGRRCHQRRPALGVARDDQRRARTSRPRLRRGRERRRILIEGPPATGASRLVRQTARHRDFRIRASSRNPVRRGGPSGTGRREGASRADRRRRRGTPGQSAGQVASPGQKSATGPATTNPAAQPAAQGQAPPSSPVQDAVREQTSSPCSPR